MYFSCTNSKAKSKKNKIYLAYLLFFLLIIGILFMFIIKMNILIRNGMRVKQKKRKKERGI